ncbi:tRNA dihydrouridine synthase DusB [Candidatus Auribacterota bacterium]
MLKIKKLKIDPPILLAPIAGFTDPPYRKIIWELGWEAAFSEMISSQALVYDNQKTWKMLDTSAKRKIFGIQLVGSRPEVMALAAKKVSDRCDLIDINLGCPVKKIIKSVAGSALLSNPKLAEKIFKQVVAAVSIPVTIKIRTGLDAQTITAPLIAKIAEESGISAITIHGRHRNQFYSGRVDFETILKVKQSVSIPVIGNGNIFSGAEAKKMMDETGVDGVMIARGSLGNPWLFSEIKHYLMTGEVLKRPSKEEIREVLLRHFHYMIEFYGENNGCQVMRKIAGVYFKGYPHVKDLRRRINSLSTEEDIKALILSL